MKFWEQFFLGTNPETYFLKHSLILSVTGTYWDTLLWASGNWTIPVQGHLFTFFWLCVYGGLISSPQDDRCHSVLPVFLYEESEGGGAGKSSHYVVCYLESSAPSFLWYPMGSRGSPVQYKRVEHRAWVPGGEGDCVSMECSLSSEIPSLTATEFVHTHPHPQLVWNKDADTFEFYIVKRNLPMQVANGLASICC